ncbi:MAG: hypothetical protein ACRD8O_06415 [Bryobacteraceae bacterium]
MSNRQWLQVAVACAALAVGAACGSGEKQTAETKPAAAPPAPLPEAPKPFIALPPETPVLGTRTFTSASKKSYKIETVKDDREEELRALPPGTREVTPMAARAPNDNFRGTARKAAKLSIANAPLETFADLPGLIATLPAHKAMANHSPPIKTTATSNRVAEEKRNVKLRVFLYAASREDDNDFHLILGRAPTSTPAVYLTMELSGLPPSSSAAYARLKAARDAFQSFFGSDLPGTSYDFYSPPIPVEIEGSLFFDMSHAKGSRPGPASLRPKMPVVWEVHPITKIVFEP